MRTIVRQLYSWQAVPGKTTDPPDLATAMPVISDNGLKQTVTHPQRSDVEHEPAAAGSLMWFSQACV